MLLHEKTNSIILHHDDPFVIRGMIPQSRTIDHPEYNVAIKHTDDAVRLLRNIGINVPLPATARYRWPGKYKPFDHQRTMVEFYLQNSHRCFNLSEPGTGKTAATLWAADILMSQGKIKRAAILAPLSGLERTWMQDIFDVLMHRKAGIVHGGREKRVKMLAADLDFYVVNHEGVLIDEVFKAISKRKDINLVVIDEGTFFRNHTTSKFKHLKAMLRTDQMVWWITGTPCPNAPTDAWAQAQIVCPHRVDKFFGAFMRRCMVQLSQFKWAPRAGSEQTAFNALQPAIRFLKKDCLNLPPVTHLDMTATLTKVQRDHVRRMKDDMLMSHAGGTISAVNAADKINKMRQILCIAEGTPVLTDRGWVAIETVSRTDRLWDGVEWVTHAGLLDNGFKTCVECDGVSMTPDHEVLTVAGWRTANDKSRDRLDRAPVRLPHRLEPAWYDDRAVAESNMAMSLRLRGGSRASKSEPSSCEAPEREALRMPSRRAYHDTQHEFYAAAPRVDGGERTMPVTPQQGFQELRGSWDQGLRTLGAVFRGVPHGHGAVVETGSDPGSDQQRRPVLATQLPVGDGQSAVDQQTHHALAGDATRPDDLVTGGRGLRPENTDAVLPVAGGVVGRTRVYDIALCGPRSRFVVRGCSGELLIVHNCGSIKDAATDTYITIDHKPRLELLLQAMEQAAAKVIIVVPFKGIIHDLAKEIQKHYSVAVLNGDVSIGARNRIIQNFKNTAHPHALLCHPQVMSHGLNFTEADMMIFYAPIYSNDQFRQVIERINRAGQTRPMTIMRIGAHPLEWEIYKQVDNRDITQQSVLKLYETAMSSTY